MTKVLVVVDMQNDFIDGSLGTKEAILIVPNVIKKIKEFDGSVYFTRDTHQEDYLATQEGIHLPIIHCIEGTKGWEIQEDIDRVRKSQNSKVFNKNTFGSKDLAQFLANERDLEEVELVGVCTDFCVISNALTIKTFNPEVKIAIDASCCAGADPEGHRTALNAMKNCQIQIVNETI